MSRQGTGEAAELLSEVATNVSCTYENLRRLAKKGEIGAEKDDRGRWWVPAAVAAELRLRYPKPASGVRVADPYGSHALRLVGEGELPIGVIGDLLKDWREHLAFMATTLEEERQRTEKERDRADVAERSLAASQAENAQLRQALAEQPAALMAEFGAISLRAQQSWRTTAASAAAEEAVAESRGEGV